MENSSKALLMAGGILTALLVVGALVLMWTNISKFQAGNTEGAKEQQIIQFNQEFETYNRDKVLGADILSIVNKIESYNERNDEVFNSKVQYEPIEVKVNFGNQLGAFTGTVILTNDSTPVKQMIDNYTNLEGTYSREFMRKLSANLTRLETKLDDEGKPHTDHNFSEAIKELFGRTGVNISNTKATLEKYNEYSTMKGAKFKCVNTSYNQETGQINKLEFSFESK